MLSLPVALSTRLPVVLRERADQGFRFLATHAHQIRLARLVSQVRHQATNRRARAAEARILCLPGRLCNCWSALCRLCRHRLVSLLRPARLTCHTEPASLGARPHGSLALLASPAPPACSPADLCAPCSPGKHRGEATHDGQELFLGHRRMLRHLVTGEVLGTGGDACEGRALSLGSAHGACGWQFIAGHQNGSSIDLARESNQTNRGSLCGGVCESALPGA
jgi:hypothetical protein